MRPPFQVPSRAAILSFLLATGPLALTGVPTAVAAVTAMLPGEAPADSAGAVLRLRQAGGDNRDDLLKKVDGPAATLDLRPGLGGSAMLQTGITKATSGDAGRRYFASEATRSVAGFDTQLRLAGDETAGAAAEARAARRFGGYAFTIDSVFDHGFDSDYTGSGGTRITRAFRGEFGRTAGPLPVAIGLGWQEKADGSKAHVTTARQSLALGPVTVVDAAAMDLDGSQAGALRGDLMGYGSVAELGWAAGLDYGNGPNARLRGG